MSTTTTTRIRRRPLLSLATAEYRQFVRNKTLVYLGTVFPLGLSLLIFFTQRRDDPEVATQAAFDIFACLALLFVQYYSVLSMVTTRRGEGVLKRLRTGEATDWQIQAAPVVPGAVLTVVGAVALPVVVYAAGAPSPANPVAIALGLLGGLVVFALLALATSGLTKNAEAAQVTSLPVMTLAIVGLGSIRGALPDRWAAVVDWTPFAAVSDLVSLGTVGRLASTPSTAPSLDFLRTFGEFGRPVVTLVAWTLVAAVLTRRYFRWDDRG